MTTNDIWIILAVAGATSIAGIIHFVYLIQNNKSSTAAIAYLFLPLFIFLYFTGSGLLTYAALVLKNVIIGLLDWQSFHVIISIIILIMAVTLAWLLYDSGRCADPNQSPDSLRSKYQRYEKLPGFFRYLAQSNLAANPTTPVDILKLLSQSRDPNTKVKAKAQLKSKESI